MTLTDDTFDTLFYEDINNTGALVPVRKGDKMLVKCFLAYNQYLKNQGDESNFVTILQANFF